MTLLNSKKLALNVLLGSIVSLFIVAASLNAAYAQPPTMPQIFYGTVTIGGSTAGAGVSIVAKVGAEQLGTGITDAQGRFNFNSDYNVNPDAGSTVNFYVNGVKAGQTALFGSGEITEVNLSVSAAAIPATLSVTTNILGNSSTFTLSGGVLASAKDVASTDSRVKLSLAANTSINLQGQTTLGAGSESNPPAAADNSTLVRAYSFTPSGATFSPAVTVTLSYETPLPSGAME